MFFRGANKNNTNTKAIFDYILLSLEKFLLINLSILAAHRNFQNDNFQCSQWWQICHGRDPSVYAPSQWEMALHCNAISHWLGTYTEWSLHGDPLSRMPCWYPHVVYSRQYMQAVTMAVFTQMPGQQPPSNIHVDMITSSQLSAILTNSVEVSLCRWVSARKM